MAVIGRAIRDNAATDRAARQRCTCGHSPLEHHEWPSTWERVIGDDGLADLVEVRHPNYAPGVFRCDRCNCGAYTHDGVNR